MNVKYRNGNVIAKGDKVVWYDPQTEYRDLQRVWVVDTIREDMVCISDEFGECECLPNEVAILNDVEKTLQKANATLEKGEIRIAYNEQRGKYDVTLIWWYDNPTQAEKVVWDEYWDVTIESEIESARKNILRKTLNVTEGTIIKENGKNGMNTIVI